MTSNYTLFKAVFQISKIRVRRLFTLEINSADWTTDSMNFTNDFHDEKDIYKNQS